MQDRNAQLSLLIVGYSDTILIEGDAPWSANTPSPGGPVKDDWLCFTRHTAKAPDGDAIECDEQFHT